MWDKLLALFKDKEVSDDIQSPIPTVTPATTSSREQFDASPVSKPSHQGMKSGRSVHLGYNYLKGMDGDYEDSSKHLRRFINLNKLLRGDYKNSVHSRYDYSADDPPNTKED